VKRRFASLDDFLRPVAGTPELGRNMANHYFLRALLRYGTFDEYHFFLSNTAHKKLFMTSCSALLDETGAREKVKLMGATAHDALICSSHAGKRVIDRCLDRISRGIPDAAGAVQRVVVPLGIDEPARHPDRQGARERLGLAHGETIALSLARFSEVDKMDLFPLLQAFHRAGCQGQPWRLVLAGAVHDQGYLKMVTLWIEALGIKDRVTVLTNLEESAKIDLLHAADFFVSPSDNPQETFGLTLLEAMWAGLPLVVSDFDGYKELATGDVGFRIPTYWDRFDLLDALQPVMDERTFHLLASQSLSVDVARLAGAMTRLFSDRDLVTRLSNAARMRFESCFSHEGIIERLERLWDALKSGFVGRRADADPLALETFDTFSHYATCTLSDEEQVRTSSLGAAILDQRGTYPLLANMADIIDAAQVVDVMRIAMDPVPLGRVRRAAGSDAWRRRYLVQWMLKHGLLELTL
jgi:glycosyltransferase involved in cell wall biosynthesis